MATAASMLSLVWNFHSTSSSSGSAAGVTPVWSGLPRKMGQSAAHKPGTAIKKRTRNPEVRIQQETLLVDSWLLVSGFWFLVSLIAPSRKFAGVPPPPPGAG